MTFETRMRVVLVAGLLLAAGVVHAQTAPASAGSAASAVPGVCLLSREAVLANSAVGKSVAEQVKKLGEQAQWEIGGERTPLEADARKLEEQRASLAAADYEQRQQALAQRWQALQEKAAHRSRELEATQAKAVERVFKEAEPVLETVFQQRGCSLLLDRNVVLAGDMGGDLTEAVVRSLDARIKTFPVQRETLPVPLASTQQP